GPQPAEEVGVGAGVGVREAAAPDAAGADHHQVDVRDGAEDVGQRLGGAEAFDAVAHDHARRPEDDVAAALQAVDGLANGLLRLGVRLGVRTFEVGDADGVEQPHERAQNGAAEVALVEQRPRMEGRPQGGQDDGRVDHAGVVGQNQRLALEAADVFQAVNANPIAQGEDEFADGPDDGAQKVNHGDPPSERTSCRVVVYAKRRCGGKGYNAYFL